MSEDWRNRHKMTGREMMKVGGAILGLMAACIFLVWLLTRLLH